MFVDLHSLEVSLRTKVREHLISANCENERGWLLYSGLDTLRAGKYYVLGLNPAEDPANEQLSCATIFNNRWSAYKNQCWRCPRDKCVHVTESGKLDPATLKPHQKRVIKLLEALGCQPEDVFATNAIFVESRTAEEIRKRRGVLWGASWSVHRWFLSIVRPQVIICLGIQKDFSSFSLLREKSASWETLFDSTQYREGKVARASLHIGHRDSLDVRIFGVPHPSWPGLDLALPRIHEFGL